MLIELATKQAEIFKQKIGQTIPPREPYRLDSNGKKLSNVIITGVKILEETTVEENREKYRFLPYVFCEDYPNGGNCKKMLTAEFRRVYYF